VWYLGESALRFGSAVNNREKACYLTIRSAMRDLFKRKRKDTLDDEQKAEFYLGSPEDVILNKLKWFRMGGGVSEQQWRDVLGVLKVQKSLLDKKYLRHWAAALGLIDLLEEAFHDAGL
jgi:hypothetical protein